MGAKILFASIATFTALVISFFNPARSRYGYFYGGERNWRASRPVAVYGYFQGREEDEDEDYDRGYYYREGYGPSYGGVTVMIRTGRYEHEGYGYGRPPGWEHGRKRGWGGCDLPPGQAKKYGCGYAPSVSFFFRR